MVDLISPLLTDLYQLTMAYGYWKLGLHERPAVFHQIFRKNPFKGNYALACGLASVIEFLKDYRFSSTDLAYLASLHLPKGDTLFSTDFLQYLADLRFTCDVDAIPEATLIFPHEPLIRITGPLLQGQLVESTILNILNFQTLIATKASRVCQAANGDTVLEFGMRRAQGPDGALSASRAAYIGGCTATSNVLAGKCYDIPVRGTHAHSWVTVFPDEMTAFLAYIDVIPHNCVLLVDTFDTIQGVKNAIQAGLALRQKGGELIGIRLDSGDLAVLSRQARELLDAAGFQHTRIIASNSLDEYVIAALKQKGAKIDTWGVGTHLVSSYDYPALDGVYKLSALQNANGAWEYKLKLSDTAIKISNPGIYQIRRYLKQGVPVQDMLYDVEKKIASPLNIYSFDAPHVMLPLKNHTDCQDLLVPVFRQGQCVYPTESIHTIRQRGIDQIRTFQANFPHGKPYPVGLERNFHETKQQLIQMHK